MSEQSVAEWSTRHPDAFPGTDHYVRRALAEGEVSVLHQNGKSPIVVREGQRFGLGRVAQTGGAPSVVEYEVQRITGHTGTEERLVLAKVVTGGKETHSDQQGDGLLMSSYSLEEGDYLFFMLDSVASRLREQVVPTSS